MENTIQDIDRIRSEFQDCQKLFTAFGDETHQYLLCVLLNCDCRGSPERKRRDGIGEIRMMELSEAMEKRHSVRAYEDREIEAEVKDSLSDFIGQCNRESGLHMQLVLNEPKSFGGLMAHYGKFSGVKNYIAVVGPKSKDLEETCGYYGEKAVLRAQQLGLNTCWVGLTYSKVRTAFQVRSGEKLCLVIALGYGKTQGVPHTSRQPEAVMKTEAPAPDWFMNGIHAALLAPTAVNQQKFLFSFNGNTVSAKAGMGFYSKTDLGIVKYHFELGAGKENFRWEEQ